MKYQLKAENFNLELDFQVFEKERQMPINTSLSVFVESDGFCGLASLDIDIKSVSMFTTDLKALYDSLQGGAKLGEPYGIGQYLEFSGDGVGHIVVRGILSSCGGNGCEQELRFENKFDQTYLKGFIEAMAKEYYCNT